MLTHLEFWYFIYRLLGYYTESASMETKLKCPQVMSLESQLVGVQDWNEINVEGVEFAADQSSDVNYGFWSNVLWITVFLLSYKFIQILQVTFWLQMNHFNWLFDHTCISASPKYTFFWKKKKKKHFLWLAKKATTTWSTCGLTATSLCSQKMSLETHLNRMSFQCETMATNQTKTLLAESLNHNYPAASTSSIQLFFSLPFSFQSSVPLTNVARCSSFTAAGQDIQYI